MAKSNTPLLNALFFLLNGIVFVQGASCPNGFISYETSCYHFSHDTETWYGATGICKTVFSGYLVEIETARENNFLIHEASSRNTEYWIGADDLQVETEWKWFTSGTPVTTATWGAPPSNTYQDENCAEINTGVWNDDACHKPQHYICEVNADLEIVG